MLFGLYTSHMNISGLLVAIIDFFVAFSFCRCTFSACHSVKLYVPALCCHAQSQSATLQMCDHADTNKPSTAIRASNNEPTVAAHTNRLTVVRICDTLLMSPASC